MIGRFSRPGVYRELLQQGDFIRVVLAGIFALLSLLLDRGIYPASAIKLALNLPEDTVAAIAMVLALASVTINGLPIIWGGIKGLVQRKLNVDELVSLAIIACLVRGEFLEAAFVSFVMMMGALIEEAASNSARKSIQSLVDIAPQTATVLVNGIATAKSISEVKVGEILLVKPGERIPVDAVVRKGSSAVDEASITGEPIPREKTIDDKIYAGTLNQNGVVEIETTKVGENTTLGKVIRLVSEAEAHRPQVVKLVDRYARWFTPVILSCAGLAWLVTGDVDRAITVLIVGCPCALVLAAPTATVATIGRAARAGILIKKGQFIEESARADVVLFDKTGTLTQGSPRVDKIISATGVDDREILTLAASVEKNSTHPFARAVLKAAHYARVTLIKAEEVYTTIGLGVQAWVGGKQIQIGSAYIGGESAMSLPVDLRRSLANIKERGATPLVVYQDRQPMGIISVSDQVRSSSAKTVRMLKDLGIRQVGVLSGDHEKSVRLIARSVGVKNAWSEMKPQEKLNIIKDFQASGNVVMFVGDGINDAPALASANIGIAMGAFGTDVALDTADIALMNDDISKIPFLISLGRRMNMIIKLNIAFGLIFNTAAVLASGGGFLTPIMGAVVHNIGSVIVVLCSASIAFTRETIATVQPQGTK